MNAMLQDHLKTPTIITSSYIIEGTSQRKFGVILELLACSIMMGSHASLKGITWIKSLMQLYPQLSISMTNATNPTQL